MSMPIPPFNVKMNPPKFHVVDSDVKCSSIPTDLNFENHEISVALALFMAIKPNLKPDSYLLTFDPREMEKLLSKTEPSEVSALIGSIWEKTRNFVNVHLKIQGDQEAIRSEEYYQLHACANMWSNICKAYSTHTLEECKQLPFYTIFTNRQAQALKMFGETSGLI